MSCQCTTLKGDRCRNHASAGSNFCHRHVRCANVFVVAKAKVGKAKTISKTVAKAKGKVPKAKAKVAKAKISITKKIFVPKVKLVTPKEFHKFDSLPIPVLGEILMKLERNKLNVICNSNKRIKKFICDDKGWRKAYSLKYPEGLFHERSMYNVTRELGPRTAMMPLETKPLIFRELKDVPIESPVQPKSSPYLKQQYEKEKDAYISKWKSESKGQWFSHTTKDISYVPYNIWLKEQNEKPKSGKPKTQKQILNDFTVSMTLDRNNYGEVTDIYYFQNAIRPSTHAGVNSYDASITLSLGTRTMEIFLKSPDAATLDNFLFGIGKEHWKKYLRGSIAKHLIAHGGIKYIYTGYEKAVSEFYDIVKKEFQRVAIHLKPAHQLVYMVDKIQGRELPKLIGRSKKR